MIRIIWIPNIFKNAQREERQIKFFPGITILTALSEFDLKKENIAAIVNGKKEENFNQPLINGDELVLIPKVEAGVGAAIVAVFSWLAANSALVGVVALAAVSYLVQMSNKPKKPNFGTLGTGGFEDSSPTYSWDGIKTIQDVNVPIPIIYGEHGCGGNIINQYIWTDGEKNYLNVLLGLSEGEIESIDTIKINGNPVANFDGVTSYKRYGTSAQTVIPNFEDLHQSYDVGANLIKNDPYVYTTIDNEVESLEILLAFPYGLYETTSTGGFIAWSVIYQVEYKVHTDVDWTDLGEITVNAKSRTSIKRIFRIDSLSPNQYDVRITRKSNDSSLKYVGDLTLQSVDEITTDDLAYPNTALLGLKLLATDQLSGSTPTITCVVKGRKINVPQIMNGAEQVDWDDYYWDDDTSQWKLLADDTVLSWDGTTYVDAYSANPVWCMKDLLVNDRYGLGEFIDSSEIDDDLYLEMAKHCEEKVEVTESDGGTRYEKRFRLDVVIDGSSSAIDLITQLSATFRGLPFYSQGKIKLRIDKSETSVMQFGMGNIVENSFAQNWKSIRDVPNVIEVIFADKNKNYAQETIAVIDETALAAGDPVRKKQVRIYTTGTSYALREGRYLLNLAKYVNRTISFKSGIEAVALQAGDVIDVSHDVPQWGFSGRVQANSTTTLIKLDQSVVVEAAKTYKIQIRFADDTIEEKTVSSTPGTYTEIEVVGDPFSQAPAENGIYAFGENTKESKPFRVMSLQREGAGDVLLTAIEHVSDVFDDTAVIEPSNNYSALAESLPDVTDLDVTERIVKLPDGTIESVLDVYWNNPDQTEYALKKFESARVFLSDDGGESWILRGSSTDGYVQVQGGLVDGTSYTVAVVSVSDIGEQNPIGDSPQDVVTIEGKQAPPGDVGSLAVSFAGDHITFSWDQVTDIDLRGYEIRELPFAGAEWTLGTVVQRNITETSFDLFLVTTGYHYYAIKAVDTSGNYSDDEATATLYISSIPQQNVVLEDDYNLSEGSLSGDGERCWMVGYNENYYRKGISLKTEGVWDDGNWDEGHYWDTPVVATSFTYITEVSDLGSSVEVGVTIALGLANVSGGQITTYIAYSDADSTPDNWTEFSPGTFTGRYFRFKVVISSANSAYGVDLYKLKATFDVADKVQEGSGVSVSDTGWTTVTLTGFTEVTSLLAMCVGNAYVVEVDQSSVPASFDIKLKNPADSMNQVAGTINYQAKGY